MTEQYLIFSWQHAILPAKMNLLDGQDISIIHRGSRNTDAGPDFFQAKIRIGNTIWVGNVEIHVHTSDWLKHNHQNDKSYDNVILHVVYKNDLPALHPLLNIPTLEMKNYIDVKNFNKYQQYILEKQKILCENFLRQEKISSIDYWLENIFSQRLQRREQIIRQLLGSTLMNIEETYYQWLAWTFGFKLNNDAFLLLSRHLPLKILLLYSDDLLNIEALLFGQAGLLSNNFDDFYFFELRNRFSFLKHKHSLEPISSGVWRFMRTRPYNYPSLRLAQLATLIPPMQEFLQNVIQKRNISLEALRKALNVKVSHYWQYHYHFGMKMPRKTRGMLTANTQNHIIINTIVPFLHMYAYLQNDIDLQHQLYLLMKKIPAEKNSIVKLWEKAGIVPQNALESQALLEQYEHFCSRKKCLECNIGATIIVDL